MINIGSVDGMHVPMWESSADCASKAGLRHLTRHLARRLAEAHHRQRDRTGHLRFAHDPFRLRGGEEGLIAATPFGRTGGPGAASGAAISFASRAVSWITGAILAVDRGYVTLA